MVVQIVCFWFAILWFRFFRQKTPRRLQRGPGFCTRCMRCFCCFWTNHGSVLGSFWWGPGWENYSVVSLVSSRLDWIQPLPRMLARTEGLVWDPRCIDIKCHPGDCCWGGELNEWRRVVFSCSPVLFHSCSWSFLEFLTPQALRNKSQACCSYQQPAVCEFWG